MMAGFRNESHLGSKKQFFITNTKLQNDLFCGNCKIETHNITTDHFPISYKQIFNNFINLENILLFDVEIFENDVNEIRLKNEELAVKFLTFHDDNSKYRLLCKSCNSHFGSYEH
jgi:hypothetical protein